MTARGVLMLVTMVVGCSQGKPSPLDYTRLKSHPAVSGGSTIDTDAVLLSLDGEGALFKDGRAATLEDVVALKPVHDQAYLDPVLIEVPADFTAARCTPLLSALIEKAQRRNVAFLVSSPSGLRALSIPVLQERGLSLYYTVGRIDYREHQPSPEDRHHLWLSLRVDGSGQIRVLEILKRRINEVWFKDQEPPGTPDPRLWDGPHPPIGPWSFEQLRTFLGECKTKQLESYCDLQVVPGDKVGDFLKCLDSLHQVARGRTIVSFIVP